MNRIVILIVISLFCGLSCRKTESDNSDLIGTKWTLSTVQDTKANTVLAFPDDASRKISIVFTDSLNTLIFSGICNGGTGSYSINSDQGTLTVLNLGATKIYCKYAEWERYTLENLNTSFSYKMSGTNLTVYSNGDYNLSFISNSR